MGNICTSAYNNIDVNHDFKYGDIKTSNAAEIDVNNDKIILKKKEREYNISVNVRAYDSSPNIVEQFIFVDPYFTSGFVSDFNKRIIIKIYSNGIEKYTQDFEVIRSETRCEMENGRYKITPAYNYFPIANISANFKYTPLADNEEITIKAFVKNVP